MSNSVLADGKTAAMRVALPILFVAIAGLTVAVGMRYVVSPGECFASGACLSGTEPGGVAGMPHGVYLPLVVGAGTGSPPLPTCEDESEPNDSHSGAQTITGLCVEGRTVRQGNMDFYRLNICSPVDLHLALSGVDEADLDLYLYDDPPGWPLHSSETVGASSEAITAAHLLTGTHYVLVQQWGAADGGEYKLDIGVIE